MVSLRNPNAEGRRACMLQPLQSMSILPNAVNARTHTHTHPTKSISEASHVKQSRSYDHCVSGSPSLTLTHSLSARPEAP